MIEQFHCQEHPTELVAYACLTHLCKLPQVCCQQCSLILHQGHNCYKINQCDIHIIKEIVHPIESLILQILRDYYDDIEEQFNELKKIIMKKYRDPQFIMNNSKQQTDYLKSQFLILKTYMPIIEKEKKSLNQFIDNLKQELLNDSKILLKQQILDDEKGSLIIQQVQQNQKQIEQNSQNDLQNQKQTVEQIKQNDQVVLIQQQQEIIQSEQQQQIIQQNQVNNEENQIEKNCNSENFINNKKFKKFISLQNDLNISAKKYQDPQFTPQNHNYSFWVRISEQYKNSDFFPNTSSSNPFTKNKFIQPEDIIDGYQGNSILKSIIYLIANHCPQYLKSLFITQTLSKEGLYAINLFNEGKSDLMIIDDYIPYEIETDTHQTLIGVNNSIWILVLEKGLAKIFNNYLQLSVTPFYLILNYLFPMCYLFNTKYENLLELIEQELKNNSLVLTYKNQQKNNKGLNYQYPYQITDIKKIKLENNQTQILMQLKNHQNPKQWKGNWGVNSHLWTSTLRSQLNVDEMTRNQFYMDQQSFLNNFNSILCYKFNQIENQLMFYSRSNQATYLQINIQKEGLYYLKINPFKSFYNYYQIVICFKENDDTYTIIGENQIMIKTEDTTKFCTFKVNLKQGIYYMYLKLNWINKDQQLAELVMYGKSSLEIVQIQKIPNLLISAFRKETEVTGSLVSLKQQTYNQIQIKQKIFSSGWICATLKNLTNIQLQLKYSPMIKNCKLSKQSSYAKNGINIEPFSNQTILFKVNYQQHILQ